METARNHARLTINHAPAIDHAMQDQQLDDIRFFDVPQNIQPRVRDWFAGREAAVALDGDRSVHLAHPTGGGRILKVKGAGLSGGPVQFGVYHRTGPKAPVFDFEGRMMDDIAAGHDGAFRGGVSFQQAATEFRVAQRLVERGYDTVPCLGYGCIEKQGRLSWCSVLDHEPGLSGDMIWPEVPLELWIQLNRDIGNIMFALAVRHDLIGYCWYTKAVDGRLLIRDVHPYRFADAYNMSQVSWVMQVFYAMHIRGNAQRLRALKWNEPRMPHDLHVWQYRAFCPDVRLEDHDELRHELVMPYMLGVPQDFSFERLISLLRRNRITSALMDACPEKFARI
jgi:hypothetical protein